MAITGRFELLIYDYGKKVEVREINNPREGLDLSKCSARISHCLEVYLSMRKYCLSEEKTREQAYNLAIADIATKYEVTSTSIVDKLTRQLGRLKAYEVRNMMYESIEGKNSKFKDTLLVYLGKNTEEYDREAINAVFENGVEN